MMVSRWHRADDKVSCAEGYHCIYIRPNFDCITCTSKASRPISQGILSFYLGGHINHFFYHVRQRPRLTGTVWRDPKSRFNGIVIWPTDNAHSTPTNNIGNPLYFWYSLSKLSSKNWWTYFVDGTCLYACYSNIIGHKRIIIHLKTINSFISNFHHHHNWRTLRFNFIRVKYIILFTPKKNNRFFILHKQLISLSDNIIYLLCTFFTVLNYQNISSISLRSMGVYWQGDGI